MFDSDEGSGPGSFLLGLGAGLLLGVAVTVVFATYQEEHFNRVVRKTRELGDGAQDLAEKAGGKIKETAGAAKEQLKKVTKSAQGQAEEVKSKVGGMADSLHNS